MTHSPEFIKTVLALFEDGYSGALVAEKVGLVSRSAALGIKSRAGRCNKAKPSIPTVFRPRRPSVLRVRHVKSVLEPQRRPKAAKKGISLPEVPGMALEPLRPVSGPLRAKPLGVPAGLAERHPAGCHWPIGYEGMHIFCNEHRLEISPYCPEHYQLSLRGNVG